MAVVGAEMIQNSVKPNVADVLNQMPVFQGSATPASGSLSNQGTAGGNNLNLRNLGANRTLVLFDGRRQPPSFATGLVDINLLPDALIERVDVVTGGASAVYGSDALAGVVNFVLDTDFTGLKASVQGGISSRGDGRNEKYSLVWGTSFAGGRGHFLFEGDASNQQQVNGDARSWNMEGHNLLQNPAYAPGNGQPQLITRLQVGLTGGFPGGIITGGPLRGTAFGENGVPFPYDYGTMTSGQYHVGGDWAQSSMMGAQSLMGGSNSSHVFTRLSYEITERVTAFAQYSHSNVNTRARCCYPYYLGNLSVSVDNPFLPQSVADDARALGLQTLPFGTTLRNPSQGFGTVIGRENDVYVLGLNGDFDAFGSGWSWDIYAQRGEAEQDFWVPYQSHKERFAQAIDAVRAPDGSIVCRSTLATPGNGCVPYNLFGTDVVTSAMIAYSMDGPRMSQMIRQDLVGGSISGEPFSTWAGPVSTALSFEYREDSIRGTSDPVSANRGWFSTQYTAFNASQDVIEGALETVVPLAKDVSWARELDINAGVRATDYSTSGFVTTWKVGLVYRPVDDLRLRFTQSRDIRAPSLNDLFSVPQMNHNTIPDPFMGNVSYPYYQINVGNPELKPEEADTTGIGVVYQPAWLSGFSASVDYFRIKTDEVIASVTFDYTLQECFRGVQAYCNNIGRRADGTLETITLQPQNQASLLTEGFDIEMGYRTDLADIAESLAGTLDLRLLATHTMKLETDSGIPGPTQVLDSAGYASTPKWGVNAVIGYSVGDFRASLTGRFVSEGRINNTLIGCMADCPMVAGFRTVDNNHVPSYKVFNFSTGYRLAVGAADLDLFLAVDNIFDTRPPRYPTQIAGASYAATTNLQLYDGLGTMIRAGFRLQL